MTLSTITEKSGTGLANANPRCWRPWPAVLLLIGLAVCQSFAAAPPEQPRPEPQRSNRFLLIVETSRAMQRRAPAVFNTVRELLSSSMQGQLRPGDTLGVWTFNEEVYSGKLPLQHWSETNATASGRLVLAYINSQSYEKSPRLDRVMEGVNRLITGSRFLTVILVTSGDQEISGTPFDQEVNQNFKAWRDRQQRAQEPMVTLLRGEAGRFTSFAVSPAPWPLDMPPLPEGLVAAETPRVAEPKQPAAPPAKPQPQNSAPAAVAPLIMVGSESPWKDQDSHPTAANPGPAESPPTVPARVDNDLAAVDEPSAKAHTQPAPAAEQPSPSVPNPNNTAQASDQVGHPAPTAPPTNQVGRGVPTAPPTATTPPTAALSSGNPVPTPHPPLDQTQATLPETKPIVRNATILSLGGGSLLAFAGLWWYFRRPRGEPEGSFITQSMQRRLPGTDRK